MQISLVHLGSNPVLHEVITGTKVKDFLVGTFPSYESFQLYPKGSWPPTKGRPRPHIYRKQDAEDLLFQEGDVVFVLPEVRVCDRPHEYGMRQTTKSWCPTCPGSLYLTFPFNEDGRPSYYVCFACQEVRRVGGGDVPSFLDVLRLSDHPQ